VFVSNYADLICGNSAVTSLEVNFLKEINFAVLLIPGFSTGVSRVMESVLMEDVLNSVYLHDRDSFPSSCAAKEIACFCVTRRFIGALGKAGH
jgi:hypothetical protein